MENQDREDFQQLIAGNGNDESDYDFDENFYGKLRICCFIVLNNNLFLNDNSNELKTVESSNKFA